MCTSSSARSSSAWRPSVSEHRGPPRHGLAGEPSIQRANGALSAKTQPGRRERQQAETRSDAPEVEAAAVHQAAHRPAAARAGGRRRSRPPVRNACSTGTAAPSAEDQRIDGRLPPSARRAPTGSQPLSSRSRFLSAKPVPRRSGRERRLRALLLLGPAAPPVVVEAVHHRARGAAVAEVALELQRERRPRAPAPNARFVTSTSTTRPKLRPRERQPSRSGAQHGLPQHRVQLQQVLEPEEVARGPLRRRAARRARRRDPLVVGGVDVDRDLALRVDASRAPPSRPRSGSGTSGRGRSSARAPCARRRTRRAARPAAAPRPGAGS